jgi:DNA repair ATPase RecN
MQLAQILDPEENISYVIQKFKENLVETCEDLKTNAKELKDFEGKINKILAGDKKKKVDAHSFIEYITSKDLAGYLSSLKPKPTKKKPLSFERLSMIIIPIFKYFEDEKVFKSDNARILKTLDLWLNFVKS